ncbi:MAG: winged helix-turn-helix transcriptional regulator [Clostridia bacterium]|nr:winged helix-turn-helix transcriptional regulator [Clostridia bacterium]MBR2389085.1 winged helix-turn-helix transcriptional regulator [Clostridia bacterium]
MAKTEKIIPVSPPPRVELSDNPVKLCNEIARLFRGKMREREDAEGVMTQPGAHLVLAFLASGDGTTQLELVHSTHLKAPTVSVILKKMEEEGIVRRECDKNDGRAVRVFLTEHGREIDREHIKLIKSVDSKALSGIDEKECETLMLLLTKIRNNLISSDFDKGETDK